MKKILRFSSLISIVLMASACSNDLCEPISETYDFQAPVREKSPEITDLGMEELANCYIVQTPGSYKFKADNRFNLGEGLPVPPVLNVEDAKLLWQTELGSIIRVELIEEEGVPYIHFEVAKAEGNSVIAALNKEGEIIWSWHIWMPKENISSLKSATGYEVMNMNLGALTSQAGDPASYGMLYQWGRKDPFPASATLTGTTATVSAPMYDIEGNPVIITNSSWSNSDSNNLNYSISHPTVCLSNYSYYSQSRDWLVDSDDTLWGERKTCYDPSPAGWKVAPGDAFKDFTSSGGYAWDMVDFNVADTNGDGKIDMEDYNYGWAFMINENESLYFPAASRFDGSYAMLMGSMSGLWGSYWSSSTFTSSVASIQGQALSCLSFSIKDQSGADMITVSPSGGASRADAYSVRCVRDVQSNNGTNGVPVVKAD